MAIPASATFDYVAVIPDRIVDSEFECVARLREPITLTGDDLLDERLVGHAPRVQFANAGTTPDSSPTRPFVLRSRITLRASQNRQTSAAAFSFHVDKRLTATLKPGDTLQVARTRTAGLGMSVLRKGTLVVAIGSVSAVALGDGVRAGTPDDLLHKAAVVFRARDPEFYFPDQPFEVRVGNRSAILFSGQATVGRYDVAVFNGPIAGIPGTDECVAIAHAELCPPMAARDSALLLKSDTSIRGWICSR